MTPAKKIIATIAVLGVACAFLVGLWQFGRLMLAFGLIWLAARNAIDRAVAVRSGYAKIPQARQIDEIIGKADHSVVNEGDETDEGVKEQWVSEVYFGGRYELEMRVDIRVDRRSGKLTKVISTPMFRLAEIERTDMNSGGGPGISCRHHHEFSAADWEKVVEANGDFSVIGIQMNNAPIPNFAELLKWSQWRTEQRSAL